MTAERPPDGLQLGAATTERRVWRFERAGWVVIALLLAATVVGLFGSSGLLPPATARGAGGLELRYPRFQRHAAPTVLEITIPTRPGEETAQLWLSRPYIEGYEVRRISPEPESAETGRERVVYTFRAHTPGQPAAVTFLMEPSRYGLRDGQAGLGEDGPPLRFRLFVYP